jgi:cytoskeleton protein RodZ
VKTEIGPTLREARIRHHIDLIEIEGRTKIRVRYLRALENEEWDVLPGPTYTRSFIRTYASFLGLDGERLADDFRRLQEEQHLAEPVSGREPRALSARPAGIGGAPRFGSGVVAALAVAGLIAVLVVLGLTGNSGSNGGSPSQAGGRAKGDQRHQQGAAAKRQSGVSIRLTATGEVWVCALAADGTPVVNGQILEAGGQEGPFRSTKFDLAFGNGAIDLNVDGKPFQVEDTPSPVGYEVTGGGVRPLPEGSRPDCT